ncbi:unnamed protein product, partial [Mesorhabditis spiculigera]
MSKYCIVAVLIVALALADSSSSSEEKEKKGVDLEQFEKLGKEMESQKSLIKQKCNEAPEAKKKTCILLVESFEQLLGKVKELHGVFADFNKSLEELD